MEVNRNSKQARKTLVASYQAFFWQAFILQFLVMFAALASKSARLSIIMLLQLIMHEP